MSHALDRDAIDRKAAVEAEAVKLYEKQFKSDVQSLLAQQPMRRVLWRFLHDMGVDDSAFATNAMAQSHAIGKQDAAKWWTAAIRDHCPEREAQIRNEGNTVVKPQEEEQQ